MSQRPVLPFSIPLLMLDIVGTLLMMLGLATHFADLDLLPPALAQWALPMAVAGFALTLPFGIDTLRRVKARAHAAKPAQPAAARRTQPSAVRRG